MSKTPRTDAIRHADVNAVDGFYRLSELSCQLETELIQAQEEIKRLKEALEFYAEFDIVDKGQRAKQALEQP